MLIKQEKYNIIVSKDKQYNGQFYTAVKTTGIFCLPSCSAKKPFKKNVIFYDTKNEAILKRPQHNQKVGKSDHTQYFTNLK